MRSSSSSYKNNVNLETEKGEGKRKKRGAIQNSDAVSPPHLTECLSPSLSASVFTMLILINLFDEILQQKKNYFNGKTDKNDCKMGKWL